MSIKARNFYWIACDGCTARTPPDDGTVECIAFAEVEQAETSAALAGWSAATGGPHYCPACAAKRREAAEGGAQ